MTDIGALRYIEDVAAGRITVCRQVRLAVERHLADLETGHERGLRFEPSDGWHAIEFFERFLRHSKGEWAGRPFILEPWQQFIVWSLFGWKRADGSRRFRTAYIEVPRKNGKTTLAAGIGLYLADADGEPGAEVYSCATKRDQARLSHAEATRMVKASPALGRVFKVFRDNLNVEETASKFEPLGRDSDSTDGLNVHGAIMDELHAWKTRDLWDVIETATGARRQPLIMAITTAGHDRNSICWEQREYTEKILEGLVTADDHFGVIYTIDQDDDWADEKAWAKANPNLGVSCKPERLRELANKAKAQPAALNSFLRRHLNVWTEAADRWILPDRWAACNDQEHDPAGLRGLVCCGALDLSSTIDISAWMLVFPPRPDRDRYDVLSRFFIPEERMRERSRRDRVPYETWVREGYIIATPGDVIDYHHIIEQIRADARRYDIQEIAFDRWGATQMVTTLQDDGMTVVDFGQGYRSMSPPMKELEKLVLEGRINHYGNPVLAWMAANVVASEDPAGNIKPDKSRSREKIDGIVALIMALDRALRPRPVRKSVYEKRGVVMV